jgi:hypothetical protein
MPVRVERQRAAKRQDMAPQCRQIRPGRLRWREVQRRQPARCVIDEHDQRAAGTAVLKPGVRAAIDLDQLAKPRPPLAQLKYPLRPPPLRAPYRSASAAPSLPRPRSLRVPAASLRQSGAEVSVFIPQQLSNPLAFTR